jgi:hypothetical protein
MSIDGNSKKRISGLRQRRMQVSVLFACVILTCSLPLWAKSNDSVLYPANYRQWTRVKSAMIGPKSTAFENNGGIHHVYANDKAMAGYNTGKFPDGAVIVADFLETKDIDNAPGVTREGSRRRIDVMVKDGNRYAETGGWGFESFRGDSETDRLVVVGGAAKCFACHATQKDHDGVFSSYRQ